MQVELLEQEVAELRQALTDKQEQERAMLQVLFSPYSAHFLFKLGPSYALILTFSVLHSILY